MQTKSKLQKSTNKQNFYHLPFFQASTGNFNTDGSNFFVSRSNIKCLKTSVTNFNVTVIIIQTHRKMLESNAYIPFKSNISLSPANSIMVYCWMNEINNSTKTKIRKTEKCTMWTFKIRLPIIYFSHKNSVFFSVWKLLGAKGLNLQMGKSNYI